MNYFYEHRSSFNIKQGDSNKLSKLFNKYADVDDDSIMSEEGTMKFFKDINVDAASMDTLVVAWMLKCEELGIIERQEFIDGFAKSGCSTIKDIKQSVATTVQNVKSKDQFKVFYRFVTPPPTTIVVHYFTYMYICLLCFLCLFGLLLCKKKNNRNFAS